MLKSSNHVALVDSNGDKRRVLKLTARARTLYATWSTALNEKWASDLAAICGVRVPPVTLCGADLLEMPFCGTSLYDLAQAGASMPRLNASSIRQLADILVFSHWIGDADRSVHHILVDGDGLWSIDYEFCGARPRLDRYPEPPYNLYDLANFSSPSALTIEKPVSYRLRARFADCPEYDVYPWNASAIFFLLREQRIQRRDLEAMRVSSESLTRVDLEACRNVCEMIFGHTDIAAVMHEFLRNRQRYLPSVVDQWLKFIDSSDAISSSGHVSFAE